MNSPKGTWRAPEGPSGDLLLGRPAYRLRRVIVVLGIDGSRQVGEIGGYCKPHSEPALYIGNLRPNWSVVDII